MELGQGEVCLIDSGNDKDAGRRVRKVLDGNGWKLRAIYNTHSNADHIGGNQYLQRQTGCAIYAPGMDCAFTRYPVLEPSYLYGGFPPKALLHKFLMAQPSDAQELTSACLPEGWESIPLPGHFFDMVGFRTQEDVVYLADCLSSKETLEKYRIGVIHDVAAYLDTLERVKQMSARTFVPAHADAAQDIAPLAQYNIDQVHQVAEDILRSGRTGLTISGGEPFLQAEALCELIGKIRRQRDIGVILYTGNTLAELQASDDPWVQALLAQCDLLVDGAYIEALNDGKNLRGSSIQNAIPLTDRYRDWVEHYGSEPAKVEFFWKEDRISMVGVGVALGSGVTAIILALSAVGVGVASLSVRYS